MARSEARVSVDVWSNDSDFVDLTRSAQGMYFFLLSQSDLSHTGVLALRIRRWSRAARDLKPHDVERDIEELAAARFVVVDHDTEELLVRSFIRRDKVYRQPNVLRAALDHLPLIESSLIRRALAVELRRIQGLDMPDGSQGIVEDMLRALPDPSAEPLDMPTANPSGKPFGTPSDMPTPGTPGERGVVTTVTTDSPLPAPRSTEHSATDEPPLDIEPNFGTPAEPPAPQLPHTHPKKAWTPTQIDADPKWVEFWAAYPSSKDKGHARTTWLKWLRNGADPDKLIAGASAYRDDPKRDKDFTKHAGTWLNGECWSDYDSEVYVAPAGARPFWEN